MLSQEVPRRRRKLALIDMLTAPQTQRPAWKLRLSSVRSGSQVCSLKRLAQAFTPGRERERGAKCWRNDGDGNRPAGLLR